MVYFFSFSGSYCIPPSNEIFEVESEIKKADAAAYINPELADAEKLKGNDWSVLVLAIMLSCDWSSVLVLAILLSCDWSSVLVCVSLCRRLHNNLT